MNCFQSESFQPSKIYFFSFIFLSITFLLLPQLQLMVLADQTTTNPQTIMTSEYPFDCALSLRDENVSELAQQLHGSDFNRFRDEIRLAEMYAESGNKSKATELLIPAETHATEEILTQLCLALISVEQYDKAMKLIAESQKPEAVVGLQVEIAKALAEHKQNEKAAALVSQALANIKPGFREPFIFSEIAVTYAKIGQFKKALQISRKIQLKWAHIKVEALCGIGEEYAKQGNKNEASTILAQALVTARLIDQDRITLLSKGEAFAKVAAVYLNNGQKTEALRVVSEGMKVIRQSDTKDLILESFAVVYAQAKEFDEALRIAHSIKYKSSELDVYLETAKELLKDGQQAKALLILDQAFAGTQKAKENDTFKITRMAEIAIVYKNANQTARAYDALHFALQTIRLQYPYADMGDLLKTAKGFYKAKLEIDAESKELLRKICAKEPIPLSQKELDKRRECEAVADRFIKRWHETLDLNILFNEMYVSNPEQRKRNVRMFYGVYKFIAPSAGVAVEKGFTDELFQAGFFAFWNLFYLQSEASLAFPDDESIYKDEQLQVPFLSDKKISVKPVQKFIEIYNQKLVLLRKKFPPEIFESPTYKARLQELAKELQEDESEKDFRITQGFEDFGVKDDVEVYYLKRGVFEFYFIEEAGKLKVLTLGFEL